MPAFQSLLTEFLAALRFYGSELVRVDAQRDSFRRRAFQDQIRATSKSLRGLIPVALLLAPTLMWVFRDNAIWPLLAAGTLVTVSSSAVAFGLISKRGLEDRISRLRGFTIALVALALIMGIGWSMILSSLHISATEEVRMFVLSTQIGLICVGALLYINLPPAFACFSTPLTLDILINVFLRDAATPWLTYPLLLVLLILLGRTVIDQSSQLVDNTMAAEQLKQAEGERASLREAEARREIESARSLLDERDKHTAQRYREMLALGERFEQSVVSVVEGLGAAIARLDQSSATLAQLSGEAGADALDVSDRARDASSAAQFVASAAQQLDAAVNEISAQLGSQLSLNKSMRTAATEGDDAMRMLVERTRGIGEIVSLISDIAGQTNLLALNATIEAARAGDAGRGFSVVAQEVKSLAEQTATAADDIALQLRAIDDSVQGAARSMRRANTEIAEVGDIAGTIAAAVSQQRDATREIGKNSLQAAQDTDDVQISIQRVAEAAQNSGSLSANVSETAKSLAEQADELRSATEAFLSELRAA